MIYHEHRLVWGRVGEYVTSGGDIVIGRRRIVTNDTTNMRAYGNISRGIKNLKQDNTSILESLIN
jgi:hypothetical protein